MVLLLLSSEMSVAASAVRLCSVSAEIGSVTWAMLRPDVSTRSPLAPVTGAFR